MMRSVAQSAVEGIRKRLYSESADNNYGDTGVLSPLCPLPRQGDGEALIVPLAAERKLRRRRRDDGAWCHVESSQDLARLPHDVSVGYALCHGLQVTFRRKDLSLADVEECLVTTLLLEMMGWRLDFAYMHAIKLTMQDTTPAQKRLGYLVATVCMPKRDERSILLTNGVAKNLASPCQATLCGALLAAGRVASPETRPVLLPQVWRLTRSHDAAVRKQSVLALLAFFKACGAAVFDQRGASAYSVVQEVLELASYADLVAAMTFASSVLSDTDTKLTEAPVFLSSVGSLQSLDSWNTSSGGAAPGAMHRVWQPAGAEFAAAPQAGATGGDPGAPADALFQVVIQLGRGLAGVEGSGPQAEQRAAAATMFHHVAFLRLLALAVDRLLPDAAARAKAAPAVLPILVAFLRGKDTPGMHHAWGDAPAPKQQPPPSAAPLRHQSNSSLASSTASAAAAETEQQRHALAYQVVRVLGGPAFLPISRSAAGRAVVDKARQAAGALLASGEKDLFYIGIRCVAFLSLVSPEDGLGHQQAVMAALQSSDSSLLLASTDVLCSIARKENVRHVLKQLLALAKHPPTRTNFAVAAHIRAALVQRVHILSWDVARPVSPLLHLQVSLRLFAEFSSLVSPTDSRAEYHALRLLRWLHTVLALQEHEEVLGHEGLELCGEDSASDDSAAAAEAAHAHAQRVKLRSSAVREMERIMRDDNHVGNGLTCRVDQEVSIKQEPVPRRVASWALGEFGLWFGSSNLDTLFNLLLDALNTPNGTTGPLALSGVVLSLTKLLCMYVHLRLSGQPTVVHGRDTALKQETLKVAREVLKKKAGGRAVLVAAAAAEALVLLNIALRLLTEKAAQTHSLTRVERRVSELQDDLRTVLLERRRLETLGHPLTPGPSAPPGGGDTHPMGCSAGPQPATAWGRQSPSGGRQAAALDSPPAERANAPPGSSNSAESAADAEGSHADRPAEAAKPGAGRTSHPITSDEGETPHSDPPAAAASGAGGQNAHSNSSNSGKSAADREAARSDPPGRARHPNSPNSGQPAATGETARWGPPAGQTAHPESPKGEKSAAEGETGQAAHPESPSSGRSAADAPAVAARLAALEARRRVLQQELRQQLQQQQQQQDDAGGHFSDNLRRGAVLFEELALPYATSLQQEVDVSLSFLDAFVKDQTARRQALGFVVASYKPKSARRVEARIDQSSASDEDELKLITPPPSSLSLAFVTDARSAPTTQLSGETGPWGKDGYKGRLQSPTGKSDDPPQTSPAASPQLAPAADPPPGRAKPARRKRTDAWLEDAIALATKKYPPAKKAGGGPEGRRPSAQGLQGTAFNKTWGGLAFGSKAAAGSEAESDCDTVGLLPGR
ncbi:AP-4 complex subunit epsilon [Diplonema papillatum]|nr:AP-4 complex subunit epsilon [Diplonema papillatum]